MNIFLIILLLGLSNHIYALEFEKRDNSFHMYGSIESGDSSRFMYELQSWETDPELFTITSSGGDLDQAMLIGEVIRMSRTPIMVVNECSSACVFIFLAGVEREVLGKIGLHRPFYDKRYFSDLNPYEAETIYEDLKKSSINYLLKMQVDQRLIDRIFKTGSNQIDYLEYDEFVRLIGFRAPFYDEWITSKCGGLTNEDKEIIESAKSVFIAARAKVALEDAISIEHKQFLNDLILIHLQRSELALSLDEKGLLKKYLNLNEARKACVKLEIKDIRAYFRTGVKRAVFKSIISEYNKCLVNPSKKCPQDTDPAVTRIRIKQMRNFIKATDNMQFTP